MSWSVGSVTYLSPDSVASGDGMQTVGVLGRATALLLIAAGTLAGCSIDRIEWESTGFPVEEVTRDLEEKHHLRDPRVECIKREVGGALWECRARAEHAEYECEVKVGPREAIRSLVCEAKAEPEPAEGDEPTEADEPEG